LVSTRRKALIGVAVAATVCVGGFTAARILAQTPPPGPAQVTPVQPAGGAPGAPGAPAAAGTPAPAAGGAATAATPVAKGDPTAAIPFSSAPHGPVKAFIRRTPGGSKLTFLRFACRSHRVYVVEMPAELAKTNRSKDAWVTLFSAYGRDPRADADTRGLSALPLSDNFQIWATARIGHQTLKVSAIRDSIGRKSATMNLWSAIHQEAKDNSDLIKAKTAWNYVASAKYDLKGLLRQLAKEKLTLGNLYKEIGLYDQANQQYQQTAQLLIAPYSAEAIAKMRAISGAGQAAAFTNASAVGIERMGMSNVYEAAGKAATTTP